MNLSFNIYSGLRQGVNLGIIAMKFSDALDYVADSLFSLKVLFENVAYISCDSGNLGSVPHVKPNVKMYYRYSSRYCLSDC